MSPFAFGGTGTGGGGGGATAQVYTPAVALFEHPEDATTLFPAGTGAEGLTVTLREPLEYGQDTSQWTIIGEQRYQGEAAVAAVAASVDMPTSGTGGIRVTAATAGTAANAWTIRGSAGATTTVVVSLTDYTVVLAPNATAANALAAINAHADLTAAYYGTETGTTVVRVDAGNVIAGWQIALNFTGGVDAVAEVPADPVHVVVDVPNMRITARYNLAAGGALTDADTLGDLKGAFDTAAEGLSSEYVGGGDANTDMTRPFAAVNTFSMADLRGLRLMLTDPVAAGAAGNNFGLVARDRFPGGAAVQAQQAHILIYSRSDRRGGVRINLDAGINGLNEHGVPVDISTGELGNEWTFTAVDSTLADQDVVRINTGTKQIIFYALTTVDAVGANTLRNAVNQAGNGVSATTFGTYNGNAHVFTGSIGDVNPRPQSFHGGRDYHAATTNPEPITVTVGPTHAHTRLYTVADGGIVLSLTNPAHDGGNGFRFESPEGSPLNVDLFPEHERIVLTIPAAGALASDILAALNAVDGLEAVYFGTETGTTTVMHDRFGDHEMLGGLDATEIEIQYAPVATGGITTADTMGDVKTAWDAGDGRISFYYNGADAATTASRLVPWEHEFENGVTDTISLAGFGLGPEQNEFTGADRAAAEAARDTYAMANPTWVEAYRGQPAVWIVLRWGTAPGTQIGQTLRANAANPPVAADWTDQDLALRGAMGQRGNPGADGMDGSDAAVNAGNVDPIIRAYAGRIAGLELAFADLMGMAADGQIPAGITRDTEDIAASRVTGVLADGNIPDGITRDTEDIAASRLTGTIDDARIPAEITRDAEVKPFAIVGGRGVQVGDMDSESAADDTVPTADGSGGVAWEAQQGAGPPPVQTHLRYAAIRTADGNFTAADFTGANAETSQTNTIDTPDTAVDAFLAFAIPNDVNDLSDIRQEGGLFSYFASFTLSGTLIELDSEDHKVYISNFALNAALIGGNWVLTPSP